MIYQTKNRQKGFALIELTIVLLVVSFIVGAIWIAADHVWENYRIYRVNQQMMTTVQNIRDYYANAQNLQSLGSAVTDITVSLDDLLLPPTNINIFPSEMRRDPTAAPGATPIDHAMNNDNPSGSFHVFVVNDPNGGTSNAFRIQLLNLSPSACVQFLVTEPVTSPEIGIVLMGSSGGNVVKLKHDGTVLSSTSAVTLPFSPDLAATWCNPASQNSNSIYLDFRLHP